jgi:hypothetical protein
LAPLVLARVGRFFALDFRVPVFLTGDRRDLVAEDFFAPLVLARVARFFVGAFFLVRAFLAGAFLAGAFLGRVVGAVATRAGGGAVNTGGDGGGALSCAISSLAPGAPGSRCAARHPAIVRAPMP